MRNRSEGWKHGKLSGHANEAHVARLLVEDRGLAREVFLARFGDEHSTQLEVTAVEDIGKLTVPTVLGDLRYPKPDTLIEFEGGKRLALSIKKSESGQVWLVTLDRFVKIVEFYTHAPVPPIALEALHLFIGGARNIKTVASLYEQAIESTPETLVSIRKQERHQKRLTSTTLKAVYPQRWQALIDFLVENIELLTLLMFSRGATASKDYWADTVLYYLENGGTAAFDIQRIAAAAQQARDEIAYGVLRGGTTIQLPTGFLQMHKGQVQFHHQLHKLSELAAAL